MTDQEKQNRINFITTWLLERASMRKCLEYEQRFLLTLLEVLGETISPDCPDGFRQLREDLTNFELIRLEHTLRFWTDAETRYEEERSLLLAELEQSNGCAEVGGK